MADNSLNSLHKLFEEGLLWQGEPKQEFSPAFSIAVSTPLAAASLGAASLAKDKAAFQRREKGTVPFGIKEIDQVLPFNGLLRCGLHEFFYQNEKTKSGTKTKA